MIKIEAQSLSDATGKHDSESCFPTGTCECFGAVKSQPASWLFLFMAKSTQQL
ncbi:Uncharacterized protein ChrSV_1194 [Chromobacterium vaccinii]|nr:Uncharacterized protein ChrSW_1194 [Chromobacterium vaccinii]QND88652.1 Uncharacterized protein ChrSV_1194 [Chromobacterium vaccinii]